MYFPALPLQSPRLSWLMVQVLSGPSASTAPASTTSKGSVPAPVVVVVGIVMAEEKAFFPKLGEKKKFGSFLCMIVSQQSTT